MPRTPPGNPIASGPASSPLLVDLYELTMGQAYLDEGLAETPATFSLFCRKLPRRWGYLVAAGLDDVLTVVEGLRVSPDDLSFLEETKLFTGGLLDRLERFHFRGEVRALPEGTPFFPQEPVLEVTAPVLEAQLVETVILNQIHFQTLVAAKASRCVEVARGRRLVDFSLRRTPGGEPGLKVARASYLAGFDTTSNVLAGQVYGIPVAGTMAHSFVQCFEDETAALRAFSRSYPEAVLLVDTYDTLEGTRLAIDVGRGRGAIDGFGVGTKMGVVADAPYLDMAYKLVAFDGEPRLKLSEGKATLPGAKQVWRVKRDGLAAHDVLDLATEGHAGEPLLAVAMTDGRRLVDESLEVARRRAAEARLALPPGVRSLDAAPYRVRLGNALTAERARLSRRRAAEAEQRPA